MIAAALTALRLTASRWGLWEMYFLNVRPFRFSFYDCFYAQFESNAVILLINRTTTEPPRTTTKPPQTVTDHYRPTKVLSRITTEPPLQMLQHITAITDHLNHHRATTDRYRTTALSQITTEPLWAITDY